MQNVGVRVDESPQAPGAPAVLTLDDSGFVDFAVMGTEVSGEYRCSDCGYGAVVHRALPPCPMCGGAVWESRPRRF
jgi:rubrerythrin